MAACDGVSLRPEVFGQFAFHFEGGFEGHGVENFVEFWHEADAVALNDTGGFEALLVILETLFWREAGHADVNAGFCGMGVWVRGTDLAQFAGLRGEQHHVDVMVMRRFARGSDLTKSSTLHGGRTGCACGQLVVAFGAENFKLDRIRFACEIALDFA
jgi:hypothetical protein